MYNNAKGDIARGETRRRGVEAARDGVLPMTRSEERALDMTVNIPLVPAYERPTAQLGLAVSSARPLDASTSPVRSKTHMPLHIDIATPPPPPPHKGSLSVSPPYPSPPTSLDSPPLTAALTAVSARA